MRADAARNRARVLDAAHECVASKGVTVSTEEIARYAGVGIGTVFRHFPTKEALLQAVFADRLGRFAGRGRSARRPSEAPHIALFAVLRRAVDTYATKHAIGDALSAAGVDARTHRGPGRRNDPARTRRPAHRRPTGRHGPRRRHRRRPPGAAARHPPGRRTRRAARASVCSVVLDGLSAGRPRPPRRPPLARDRRAALGRRERAPWPRSLPLPPMTTPPGGGISARRRPAGSRPADPSHPPRLLPRPGRLPGLVRPHRARPPRRDPGRRRRLRRRPPPRRWPPRARPGDCRRSRAGTGTS